MPGLKATSCSVFCSNLGIVFEESPTSSTTYCPITKSISLGYSIENFKYSGILGKSSESQNTIQFPVAKSKPQFLASPGDPKNFSTMIRSLFCISSL